MTEEQDLPAGRFSFWLRGIREAQVAGTGADVPCGECNACCRSSYFIHVGPEETETLDRIPGELLFPAPGLPEGHVLLGFDENGHCPMLVDDRCSIYDDRPQTCRNFDCRIFPATGLAAGDDAKALIDQQVQRWDFSFPARQDRNEHSAVQAAAAFLREREELFPDGVVPSNSTQLAVLAIKVFDVFLEHDKRLRRSGSVSSDLDLVKAVIEAMETMKSGPASPAVGS